MTDRNPNQPISASEANYIKLGGGGVWEQLCLGDGTLQLGYYEVPHELGLAGDGEAIREIFLGLNMSRATASSHARQVLEFYNAPPDTVWITFANGFLWWCFASEEVEFFGKDKESFRDGSRLRRTSSNWSNKSIGGTELRISDLGGRLTATGNYRQTICDVAAFDYLIRTINDEDLPEVTQAKEARQQTLGAIQNLTKLLTWQDFELLVDLIFSQSGWQRTGEVGSTQKTIDINLRLPSTGERAFVQVKAKTNQRELDEYVERLRVRDESKMFYVFHTAVSDVACTDPRVTLVGPKTLSEMVLEAGLFDWLIRKVG